MNSGVLGLGSVVPFKCIPLARWSPEVVILDFGGTLPGVEDQGGKARAV